jgi:signal transduction histidine kinase
MALIHNAPRAATVTSKSEVVVLELDKEGFDRVLKHSPSVSMAMVREISNRLRQNDAMAIEDLRVRASELAAAYQKLAEQEMARNEFLSSVAHELRTPLMAASGYLTHLQKGSLPKDQLDIAVDTVSRNVSQIISLVNDILFLQEIELVLPEFQPVDMIQITDSIINRYRKKADAQRVRLRIRSDRTLPRVLGDARSLERALTALVDNAIKFSPYGGDVEVRLQAQRDRVEIAVEDHGIGIDPAIRPHIFDRFFHIEKSGGDLFGGIGLGLAITRQVIQQHRGALDVESKPGRGSTFTISLLKTV